MHQRKITRAAVALTALSLSLAVSAVCSAASKTPNFNGVWQIVDPVTQLKAADGKAPPLTSEAKKTYDRRVALFKAGKANEYDPTLQGCKPLGAPRNIYDGSQPADIQPFEIQQNDTRLMFGYTFNRTMRFVDIKKDFGDIPGPTYYGTSIGKWEGETLVVTGKMFNDITLLDAAGMPHSDELETVERFTLKDGGNTLEDRITFKDKNTFSKNWDAVVKFKKLPAGTKIQEDLCLQRLNITLKSPVAE
ncbi:MAG: hypothetical protein QM808_16700 [Steroidobacteraceae bacterium]